MAQQVFAQWHPVAKALDEENNEVYIPFAGIHAQTRDGKDEVIFGAGAMVWDPDAGENGMWVPVDAANPLEVRVRQLEAQIAALQQFLEGRLNADLADVLARLNTDLPTRASEQTLVQARDALSALAGTVDAGAQKVTLTGSTALSKAGLGANVTQNKAVAFRGLNHELGTAGTDLSPGEAVTVLNVSGFGRIHHIVAAANNPNLVRVSITIDGTAMAPHLLERPDAILNIQGGSSPTVGKDRAVGPVYLIRYDTTSSLYMWGYDLSSFGVFGSSTVVTLRNNSGANAFKGYLAVFYAVGSSVRLSYSVTESLDAQEVHTTLAETLERPWDEFTVVVGADEDAYRLEVFVRGHYDDAVREQIEQVLAGFGVEV